MARSDRLARIVRRNRVAERTAQAFLALAAACVILPIVLFIGFIVVKGIGELNWAFLSEAPNAVDASGGVFPAIVGTIYVVLGTAALALPLGVAGGVYLAEYAGESRMSRWVRLAILNLAGVPSIVHGLFGLGFFVFFVGGGIDRWILHSSKPVWGQPCLLWGCATLAVVVLPVVITATEEALRTVPQTFREASLGLGASKWQTVRKVALPAALPGILTGGVLSMGRAAGETAPVMITCAASFKPDLPQGWNDQAMLLPYHLYFVATQVPNPKLETEAGITLVLIALVFALSLSAILYRSRLRKHHPW